MKHFIAYILRKLLVMFIVIASPIWSTAQDWSGMEYGDCLPDLTEATSMKRTQPQKHSHRIPPIKDLSGKTEYKQLVILVEFADCQFTCANPQDYYYRMFNESGFTESQEVTLGSMSEYLMAQSNGKFHVTFDIAGPYRVSIQEPAIMGRQHLGKQQKCLLPSILNGITANTTGIMTGK